MEEVSFAIDARPGGEGRAEAAPTATPTLLSSPTPTSSSVATAPMTVHSLNACLALLRTARSPEDVVAAVEAATDAVDAEGEKGSAFVPDVDACVTEVRQLLLYALSLPDDEATELA